MVTCYRLVILASLVLFLRKIAATMVEKRNLSVPHQLSVLPSDFRNADSTQKMMGLPETDDKFS